MNVIQLIQNQFDAVRFDSFCLRACSQISINNTLTYWARNAHYYLTTEECTLCAQSVKGKFSSFEDR